MEIEGVKVEKVWYKHYRYLRQDPEWVKPYSRGRTDWTPTCKGGATICTILDENGNTFCQQADCSKKDAFVYKTGRQIALGRAQKQMREYYSEIPF